MKRLILAFAIAAAPLAALAQHSHRGLNGGTIVDASGGPYHAEFLARGTELTIFLVDENNKPVPAARGATGRAVVQDGGKTAAVPLQFTDPNRFIGTLGGPLGKGARVVLWAKLADGRSIQARFVQN